ncbi:hypothetical protein GUJ93_ZPchr0007g3405 [Zizania palustris]|uniref:Uncharacterized protein n=1 Tax=Zizania palustris TaxID=103762 RepID=A0A8J5TEH2_ZIZPA|nr:hypothetical protein GUJ93_ZPchr0007g3405 [Zizania palustris]
MASSSVFAGLAQAPEDPILGVTVAYTKDPSPVKVNLGAGAYRTRHQSSKQWVAGTKTVTGDRPQTMGSLEMQSPPATRVETGEGGGDRGIWGGDGHEY